MGSLREGAPRSGGGERVIIFLREYYLVKPNVTHCPSVTDKPCPLPPGGRPFSAFPRFIEILSVLTVRKLKMTLPVPRDPLGLRHSRPSGFDSEPIEAKPKTTFSLIGEITINQNKTHIGSPLKMTDAGSDVCPFCKR